MSDLKASVHQTEHGFHVEGYEKIEYDFTFVDGVFDIANPNLAQCYKKWGRVLAVTDKNVYSLYGQKMERYFQHHGLELKVHKTSIGEKAKTIDTFLSIADSMTEFGIIRKVRSPAPRATGRRGSSLSAGASPGRGRRPRHRRSRVGSGIPVRRGAAAAARRRRPSLGGGRQSLVITMLVRTGSLAPPTGATPTSSGCRRPSSA